LIPTNLASNEGHSCGIRVFWSPAMGD
jgi:hypothetical protein